MIDLDECRIELKTAKKNQGKAYIGKWVNQPGLYSQSEKTVSHPPITRTVSLLTFDNTHAADVNTFLGTRLMDAYADVQQPLKMLLCRSLWLLCYILELADDGGVTNLKSE